jgi:hypothetical protein
MITEARTLSDSESMMAWLEHRIAQTTSAETVRTCQKKFLQMWRDHFGNTDDIPHDFKEKVTKRYAELLLWGEVKP